MSEPSSALAHGLPNAVTSHLTGDLVSQQTLYATQEDRCGHFTGLDVSR